LDKSQLKQKHINAVTTNIKEAMDVKDLYFLIYGKEPEKNELQTFTNRLNPARSNPGTEFLGLCIEHIPELHNMTLAQFFGIESK